MPQQVEGVYSPSETVALVERYRRGDEDAARLLFDRYVQRLRELAGANLPSGLRRRFGLEDVVQSVFRSLFRAVKGDRVKLERSGDLWTWLLQVTFNKLRGRVAYELAEKRSVNREKAPSIADASGNHPGIVFWSKEPSVEDLVAIADELDYLFGPSGSPLRCVVDLRLQDHSMEEIGERLGISHTTVSRRLKRIKRRLAERLSSLSENGLLAGESTS
jgi:RNA polymerase sigma factor (sigma-70 family)